MQTSRPPKVDGSRLPARTKVGLVLAGGASRGAYEVGVLLHIIEDVAKSLGRDVPLDVLCGTSAGSINVCGLAAHADSPKGRAHLLAKTWQGLRMEDIVRPAANGISGMFMRAFDVVPRDLPGDKRRGGLLALHGIDRLIRSTIPFERIQSHLDSGRLSAVTVSTTHVASGRTIVFVQQRSSTALKWGNDPTMVARPASLTADHTLASAAVPLLFPAVRLGGEFFCDGGLRQNVPLSPARRLGAGGLIVINPRYIEEDRPTAEVAEAREADYPDPLFLLGKALNALLLDRIENDIDRLRKLNKVLAAGTRRFGPGFLDGLNEEMGGANLRELEVVYIRASQDIGELASEYVRSPAFAKRSHGWLGKLVRRLGEREREADLLSYVLFDGAFSEILIELGRHDARARHDELVAFFDSMLRIRP